MKSIKLIRKIHNNKSYILIYGPEDHVFSKMIREYPGSNLSRTTSTWYVVEKKESIRSLISYFKEYYKIDATGLHIFRRKATEDEYNTRSCYSGSTGPVKMIVDPSRGRLTIQFLGRYEKKWISELKQYCRPYYDTIKREWHLPASRVIMDSLTDYFNKEGVQLVIRKATRPEAGSKERESITGEIRRRDLRPEVRYGIEELIKFLKEQRYSNHTLYSYLSHLELFFKYYHNDQPGEITNDDLTEFMEALVIKQGYSASFQNQLLSAIKAYYYFHGTGKINLEEIQRPRKSRPLPQVLSKEEVTRILQSTRNSKHRLLLSIIYSCGLRRSEVINIRLTDLNRDRKTLHIRAGKGNVDRVVPVSDKVWSKLDEYITAYRPGVYLFEGQNGGRYSVGSVYRVFCQAAKRAGIEKDLGVHSLRHSYATHLHEGGLDIRYIQELLGHKSSKTTEIYTHVSRRNLLNIKNPLDDLDIQ
ncbi:MAG: tyrosine-type recombinase/integrase [Bacteroidales bacterium]|nr:tyrosine-type recombinase/integrase [Bacteroidales bacterium]